MGQVQAMANWCTHRLEPESVGVRAKGTRSHTTTVRASGSDNNRASANHGEAAEPEASAASATTATSELVDMMFDNECGANWEQYRAIKERILRSKPGELRSHHIAELVNQLDELRAEAESNGLYSLEDRVAELRDIVVDKQMRDLGAELPAQVASATSAARVPDNLAPKPATASVPEALHGVNDTAAPNHHLQRCDAPGVRSSLKPATVAADRTTAMLGLYAAYGNLHSSPPPPPPPPSSSSSSSSSTGSQVLRTTASNGQHPPLPLPTTPGRQRPDQSLSNLMLAYSSVSKR